MFVFALQVQKTNEDRGGRFYGQRYFSRIIGNCVLAKNVMVYFTGACSSAAEEHEGQAE